jgi:murein L,D-transpeptidase YafK
MLLAACSRTSGRPLETIAEPQPSDIALREESAAAPECLQIIRIEVGKRERILRAYCKRGAVVTMTVAIGRDEVGPKLRSGDDRTPEGKYRISGLPRQGRFHLFIPIDYPSEEDAVAARAEGRISEADYHRIIDAHGAGVPPPYDTALGGDLGFHGEGERWEGDSEHLDWTYGCVALSDDEIDFLASRTETGVTVWIYP